MSVRYFRAVTRIVSVGIIGAANRPDVDLSGIRQSIVALSEDRSEAAIMVEVSEPQRAALVQAGAIETTREELGDISAFPSAFSPPLMPFK